MNFKKSLLLFGDIIIYYLALFLTLIIRYQEFPPSQERISIHLVPFTAVLAIWLIVFLIANLYSLSFSRNNLEFLTAWFSASAVNLAVAFTFFYIVPTGIRPRANMFLLAFIFFILQYLWRSLFTHLVSRETFQKNTLFIGTSPEALALAKVISDKPQLGYRLAGFWKSSPPAPFDTSFRLFNESEPLSSILEREKVKCVVLADNDHDPRIIKDVFSALNRSITLFSLADMTELLTGKIPVTAIGEMWFLQNIAKKNKFWFESIKRITDTVGAILLLVPSILISPLIALLIRLDSPGPIFFKQIRTGKLGKSFLAIKFRSMRADAEQFGPQWAQKNDPRVTRFGRFMRKTRLDEIPQLWNILKGDLSFVGPRPERPEFVEQLKKVVPFYNERHLVKPGLTGWDQISGKYHSASPEDTLEKLQYDLYYVKNRSLWLDLIILLKTVKTILTGVGR